MISAESARDESSEGPERSEGGAKYLDSSRAEATLRITDSPDSPTTPHINPLAVPEPASILCGIR